MVLAGKGSYAQSKALELMVAVLVMGLCDSQSPEEIAQDERIPPTAQFITLNPRNPSMGSQEPLPFQAGQGQGLALGPNRDFDKLLCFILNTNALRMDPQGFGGSAPKYWTSYGYKSGEVMETQVLFPPTAAFYRPLSREPKFDGCAYQATYRGGIGAGCKITGVDAQEVPAGGFDFPYPYFNNSHCQLFSSCIDEEVWSSDPRHAMDLGAQGQWCSELGGCWQPASGLKTPGCLCYSDRPLKDWYGEGVEPEPVPPPVDGTRALNCTLGWINVFGSTRCGYSGFGQLNQHPTGRVIRDRGEGKQENPSLKNKQTSRLQSEELEQDSASFVFRRHPDCLEWEYVTNSSNLTNSTLANGTAENSAVNMSNLTLQSSETTQVDNSTYTASWSPFKVAPDSIRSKAAGKCQFEGQIQLGARVVSDTLDVEIAEFRHLLNHSVVYTLRLTAEPEASVFELLKDDGTTVIERIRMKNRFCHDYKLGRNLGLNRLPLADIGETAVNETCTWITPVDVCYSSDPFVWGTDAWRRNSASHFQRVQGGLERDAVIPETNPQCVPPFCIPR